MKTIRGISEKVATQQNFIEGFNSYASGKPLRTDIREYERNLAANVKTQIRAFETGTWVVPEYEDRVITEHGKKRRLGVYPCPQHVMEWAMLNHIEKPLTDAYIRNSCSCVKGRGQTDFVDIISRRMRNDVEGTRYGVQLDVHHYFPSIEHNRMEQVLGRKIWDEKVMAMLTTILNSYPQGLVLGTKLSQIEANFLLVKYDHDAATMWGVRGDPEREAYWRMRYVNWCIDTCRTKEQADELNKGIAYLNAKFDRQLEEGIFYARFADNIIMLSGDKAFLHIATEIAIARLCSAYGVTVNRSWNVRPVEPDGIDVCGYVMHHFYRTVRKRNKQTLWREVISLRRQGKTPEEIRLRCASRIGWLTHADCRNLLRKMNVNMEERLGKKIKAKRTTIPFEGMTREQKRSIEDYLCHIDAKDDPAGCAKEESEKTILLMAYVLMKSPYGGEGADKQRAALRFKELAGTGTDKDGNITYQWKEQPLYMWTGSKILIDQMTQDFSEEDLPAPTAIHEYENKYRKKFYKFT